MDQFIRNYENFPKPGSKMNQIDRNENLGILETPSTKIVMIWYGRYAFHYRKDMWKRYWRQKTYGDARCARNHVGTVLLNPLVGSHDGAISSKGWMLVTDVGDEMCWWPIYYVGKVTNILKKITNTTDSEGWTRCLWKSMEGYKTKTRTILNKYSTICMSWLYNVLAVFKLEILALWKMFFE